MTDLTEDRFRVRTRLGVNMVVEAGAGTGKTTLLIDRLCFAVLAQDVQMDRLVALTFTEKAAAEIKTRLIFKLQAVVRAVREQGEDPTLHTLRSHFGVSDEDILSRADEALSKLDRSQISTIHSFCADILRSFPLEAGLTPNAEIDKGPRAARIFDTLWNRFLDRELGENAPRAAMWKEVLRQVTLSDLRGAAWELCSGKIESYDYFGRRDLIAQACEEKAEEAARLAGAFLDGKKPRSVEKALMCASEQFMHASRWLYDGTMPPQEEPLPFPASAPAGWDPESFEEAKALCRFARQADPHAQDLVLKAYQLLGGVVAQVRAQYAAEGVLSFDDLIVKTRNLLQTDFVVRGALKKAYDALFIDEFQDTDPVQGELLLFLAERPDGRALTWRDVHLQPGKLFVVGDPKQSIYRFRGADITAYELFTDLILKQGGEKAFLRQNFRSEREIIGTANEVCSAVMTEKPAFQPAYEAIFTDKTEQNGAAELALVCSGKHKASADELRHNQAQFIARWINENVGKMTLRGGRKLQYGDIALLTRAATTLAPYTDALRREGVPFSIEEDRDFYRRQEIHDFLNLLRAADNPRDKIALVGVMRSPLGALTDEEVYQAARRGELNFRAHTQDPKLARLFAFLQKISARAGRQTLRRFMRGLLAESFLTEACALAYDGEQSAANIEKLVALAEGYSLDNPATLGQFLCRVQELMEQELSRLSASSRDEALDAVSVMTVHKSKGLEFPVVILADISKKEGEGTAKRPAHLYSWRHDLHGLRVGPYADINLAWLEEEQKKHGRCEEIRVLYVALTRAREKLLLVGNEQSDARTFAAQLRQAGLFPDEDRPEKLGQQSGLRITYLPYVPPAQFIYLHRPEAQVLQAKRDLKRWREAYEKRRNEYVILKADTLSVAPSALSREPSESSDATDLGVLCHAALACCWGHLQRGPDECVEWAARQAGRPDLADEARAIILPFLASPLFRRLRGMKFLGAEVPFSLKLPRGRYLNGAIDLLLQEEDGSVLVVDYKTDRVDEAGQAQVAQQYRPQLQAYEEAARAMYPDAAVHAALVFLRTAQLLRL